MKKGGIRKALLLSVAMFICGYLTAVCTINPDSLKDEETVDYGTRLSAVTSQIKDAVKEHGSSAYAEISEFLKSLDEKEQTEK
jgi:hypothetical protein